MDSSKGLDQNIATGNPQGYLGVQIWGIVQELFKKLVGIVIVQVEVQVLRELCIKGIIQVTKRGLLQVLNILFVEFKNQFFLKNPKF